MNEVVTDKKILCWLLSQTKKSLSGFIILIILNAMVGGIISYTAIQSKKVIDLLILTHGTFDSSVYRSVSYYIVLILFTAVANYIMNILNDRLKLSITINMQNNLISSFFSTKFEKINNQHSGKLNTYLYSDIPYVSNAILTIIPMFINMFTRLASAFFFLFFLDKFLATFLVILGVFLVFIVNIARKYSQKLYKLIQEKNERTRSFIQDSLLNNLPIRIFNKSNQIQKEINQRQQEEFEATIKRSRLSNFNSVGFFLTYQIGFIGILVLGGYRIAKGTLSLGSLTALIQLSAQVQAPIANIAGLVPLFWGMVTSTKRIMGLIIQENDVEKCNKKTEFKHFEKIVGKELSYSYGNKLVLNHINFTIKKGELIAITGASGSGKTTLLMLLSGLIESDSIEVFMNDKTSLPINDVEFSNSSFVPQKELLFEASIRDNIVFFDDQVLENQLNLSALISESHDFIINLDNQYDTVISENGKSISQGQAQRISIARAVYSNADIIFLDEATSALDIKTEHKVIANLLSLNKTIVMITHRLEIIKYADKHFHIEKGKLIDVRI